VNTIDQGTQQNAAMVEETSAAAHSLAKEAEALFQLLSQFKIGSNAPARRSMPVPVSAAARPVASQPRQMVARISNAFQGNAAIKTDSWEEF
jgi:methyl-accepting chemotaxis protein